MVSLLYLYGIYLGGKTKKHQNNRYFFVNPFAFYKFSLSLHS